MPLKVACRASDPDKHEFDVTFLLYNNGKLYSASDDGKIKLWSLDLIKIAEVHAHPCSVFCLSANNKENILYSCSSDGTMKCWNLDNLEAKETVVSDPEFELWRVAYSHSTGILFSGDDQGNIKMYKNNKLLGNINISEPIKDMTVHGNLIFTVKDLDLVVTEIVEMNQDKIKYGTKITHMGRAPVTLIGERLFAFCTREGKEIQLHENNTLTSFKQVARTTNAANLIINALTGTTWNNQEQFFSGGWDKTVNHWKIFNNCPTHQDNVNVDIVINSLVCGENGSVYAGGADGHIVRVDV